MKQANLPRQPSLTLDQRPLRLALASVLEEVGRSTNTAASLEAAKVLIEAGIDLNADLPGIPKPLEQMVGLIQQEPTTLSPRLRMVELLVGQGASPLSPTIMAMAADVDFGGTNLIQSLLIPLVRRENEGLGIRLPDGGNILHAIMETYPLGEVATWAMDGDTISSASHRLIAPAWWKEARHSDGKTPAHAIWSQLNDRDPADWTMRATSACWHALHDFLKAGGDVTAIDAQGNSVGSLLLSCTRQGLDTFTQEPMFLEVEAAVTQYELSKSTAMAPRRHGLPGRI